jgi:hypothetical protein
LSFTFDAFQFVFLVGIEFRNRKYRAENEQSSLRPDGWAQFEPFVLLQSNGSNTVRHRKQLFFKTAGKSHSPAALRILLPCSSISGITAVSSASSAVTQRLASQKSCQILLVEIAATEFRSEPASRTLLRS